ncbi:nitrite reductase [Nocardioides terrisoli]|uniref:nitrite reductase n=1 Tax=Nocardioides terrisoli TaxID=3388267 RepID=UPI00287B7366|nr:nitrite reductase [Nocardioides marmorisolisilvae]
MTAHRDRRDRCPGLLRPWPADDGLLVRLRLVGGRVPAVALRSVAEVAERFGDGHVHLTTRANLQIRGLPVDHGAVRADALGAIESTGLVPTRTHELVRNVMVSPQTGLAGGRADLRPVAAELDRLLCASPRLGDLPGRFLFVLDDGRGDVLDRSGDLGLCVLDADLVQLRVGTGWGPRLPLRDAATRLADLAGRFLDARGTGPAAAWHVAELVEPLLAPVDRDPRVPEPTGPLRYGEVGGGVHVEAPGGRLDRAAVERYTAGVDTVVVTPWRGLLIPEERTP